MRLSLDEISSAIPLAAACQLLPGRPSIATLRRWATKGLQSGAKLRVVRIGGKMHTTKAAIEEFIAADNGDATSPRRQSRAENELAALGV